MEYSYYSFGTRNHFEILEEEKCVNSFFRKIGHHLNQVSKIANSTVHSVSLKKTSRVNSF